jgi:hypothetical protein
MVTKDYDSLILTDNLFTLILGVTDKDFVDHFTTINKTKKFSTLRTSKFIKNNLVVNINTDNQNDSCGFGDTQAYLFHPTCQNLSNEFETTLAQSKNGS